MLFRRPTILMIGTACGFAQAPHFSAHILQHLHKETVKGYALQVPTLVTWGDRILWRSLPQGRCRVVPSRGRGFLEGGCLLDIDGDGQRDLVVNEPGALVWFHAPRAGNAWSRHVIDTDVDAPDMLPASLFGRRGLLLIQKRSAVRFYEIPADPTTRWPYQDVYSFYSPSHQGGLRMADIDGDGRPDILAGMYWIRAPESLELPWRLFAITVWNQTPESAMLRLSYGPLTGDVPELAAAQREMSPARFSRFEKPADPRQLWIEHPIEGLGDLAEVNSLDAADFDGDGRTDLLLAEKAGAGRLIVMHNDGGGRFTPLVVAQGRPVRFARAVDVNGDGRTDILAIRQDAIVWFENRWRTTRAGAASGPSGRRR